MKVLKNIAKAGLKLPAWIKKNCYTPKAREYSPRQTALITFLNRWSLLFHALAALLTIFVIEIVSRRSLFSACSFVASHTLAYLYNAFIIFASLMLVYLVRRRCYLRTLTLIFWTILGIINGCVLSKRVTPFGFTDLTNVSELLSMTESGYITRWQVVLILIGAVLLLFLLSVLAVRMPVYRGKRHRIAYPVCVFAMLFIALPLTTEAAKAANVVESYYSNIAQGYKDNGFVYSFSSSVVGVGMTKPEDYSEETVDSLLTHTDSTLASNDDDLSEDTKQTESQPNIICVLLESFCDPDEINFLQVEGGDPIPTFHELEQNYSTGYLTVPVVGAGTANSEFEVLSGMSLQYFGTGEYPYKTILKETDCESVASDLKTLGYAAHAVHNNGGNFYSRAHVFSMFGFDSFTSKELMDITEYTPLGSWASDSILVSETIKTLDSTPDQPDFTYTITVGTHGAYPTDPVLEDPAYTVTGALTDEGAADTEVNNQWTYYVNQLHAADEFISGLIEELENRDEDTIVVLWGDHLPTMGLTDDDMKSGDIYKTKYVTWNNMGLEKEDADLYAYQLMASVTASAGIEEGTLLRYHQAALSDGSAAEAAELDEAAKAAKRAAADTDEELIADTEYDEAVIDGTEVETPVIVRYEQASDTITTEQDPRQPDPKESTYLKGLETLQYDILYGDRYCYDGSDPYPASEITMGVDEVTLDSVEESTGEGRLLLTGTHFTNWSKVYVNGEKISTEYISGTQLSIDAAAVKSGDSLVVCQVGSKNTVFRSSNEYLIP